MIGRRVNSLCSVDEIELIFKDTVVDSFGVDAHISFCLNTWGKGLSQVRHLKPLSIGVTPSNTTTIYLCEEGGGKQLEVLIFLGCRRWLEVGRIDNLISSRC